MKTVADIYQTLEQTFLGLYQKVTDWNIGADVRSFLEAIAHAVQELWYRVDLVYQDLFILTARGDALTWRGTEMQESRKPADVAAGTLYVTVDAACTIPKDWVVGTDPSIDPRVEVITTESVTATAAGHYFIACQSTAAGANQNVPAGRLTFPKTTPSHVTAVTNQTPISGGCDIESDDDYRIRLGLRWYQLSQGEVPDRIRSLVLDNVDDVAEARVLNCVPGPGSLKVVVWSRNGAGDLIPASAATLAEVQTYLDGLQVPCRSITCSAPTGPTVDVMGWLSVSAGYVWATVADAVDAVIRAYFADLATAGTPFIIFELYARVGALAGISDFKLDTPKANIYPDVTEALMLGAISLIPFDSRRSFYGKDQ